MKKKADSIFNNFISKGKKLVDKVQKQGDFDSGSDDDLIEINKGHSIPKSEGDTQPAQPSEQGILTGYL